MEFKSNLKYNSFRFDSNLKQISTTRKAFQQATTDYQKFNND
jgi:hypothetical protein